MPNLPTFLTPELTVFFMAMVPIIELRGAIPYGIFALHLDPATAFFWGTLGNILPNFIILKLLPLFSETLRKHWKWWDRFLKKTHDHHSENFKKRGLVAIIIVVGIPIPGSGSWTGSLIAYLFDLEYKRAVLAVSIGVLIAGLIILGVSTGAFAILRQVFFQNLA